MHIDYSETCALLWTTGAIKIAKALQNTSSLTIFSIYNNNISEEASTLQLFYLV